MEIEISCPLGTLFVKHRSGRILSLELKKNSSKKVSSKIAVKKNLKSNGFEVLEKQKKRDFEFEAQLVQIFNRYFLGCGTLKKIPIYWDEIPAASEFDLAVWKLIARIPQSQTLSYTDLAKKLGKPKAQRAVANACGRNPILLLIPCHRVVAKNGIGGYRLGVEIKKKLLDLELTTSAYLNTK